MEITFNQNQTLELTVNFSQDKTQLVLVDGKLCLEFKSDATNYIVLGGQVGQHCLDYQSVTINHEMDNKQLHDFILGFKLASHNQNIWQKNLPQAKKQLNIMSQVTLTSQELDNLEQVYLAHYHTRMLSNAPHNELNADTLCQKVESLFSDLNCEVIIERLKECQANQYTGTLAINQGAHVEPAMITIKYFNHPSPDHIALVGKGVTYDMGGNNIKKGKGHTNYEDMAGASGVIGTMYNLIKQNAKVNVIAYMPVCENLINELALVPGDLITYPNNITVNVINTDAEGRLILADGIIKAQKEGAKQVITMATLTGSIVSTLGDRLAGVYGNDENVLKLVELSQASIDHVWQMPLVKEYAKYLKADRGDIYNIGKFGYAGSVMAALFLNEFIDNTTFIHIDMAGMSGITKAYDYHSVGASSFGVDLLTRYTTNYFNN